MESRAIERKLRFVEKLLEPEASEILALPLVGAEDEGEDTAMEGAATEPKNK